MLAGADAVIFTGFGVWAQKDDLACAPDQLTESWRFQGRSPEVLGRQERMGRGQGEGPLGAGCARKLVVVGLGLQQQQ